MTGPDLKHSLSTSDSVLSEQAVRVPRGIVVDDFQRASKEYSPRWFLESTNTVDSIGRRMRATLGGHSQAGRTRGASRTIWRAFWRRSSRELLRSSCWNVEDCEEAGSHRVQRTNASQRSKWQGQNHDHRCLEFIWFEWNPWWRRSRMIFFRELLQLRPC